MAARLRDWTAAGALPLSYTTWNKQNIEADPVQCGRFRPDFVFEVENEQRVVILEYDEQAHSHYTAACDIKRQGELALGYGGRPLHLIRYNPDGDKRSITNTIREALLLQHLSAALAPCDHSRFDHHLVIEYLFYPSVPEAIADGHVQTLRFQNIVPAYEEWAMRAEPLIQAAASAKPAYTPPLLPSTSPVQEQQGQQPPAQHPLELEAAWVARAKMEQDLIAAGLFALS